MPIKPENKGRYPRDWRQIRERILARAGHRCEACGLENHIIGYREADGRFVMLGKTVDEAGEKIDAAEYDGNRVLKIVLTVAHLDHTPENCSDDNLRAWCQKCHLAYDHDHHQANAAATRRAKANTRELFA